MDNSKLIWLPLLLSLTTSGLSAEEWSEKRKKEFKTKSGVEYSIEYELEWGVIPGNRDTGGLKSITYKSVNDIIVTITSSRIPTSKLVIFTQQRQTGTDGTKDVKESIQSHSAELGKPISLGNYQQSKSVYDTYTREFHAIKATLEFLHEAEGTLTKVELPDLLEVAKSTP